MSLLTSKLPALVLLLRLMSSTILMFPSFILASHSSTGPLEAKILEVSYFLTGSKVETVNGWWKAALLRLSGEEDPKMSWEEELADAIVEVGEALCLNSNGNHSWWVRKRRKSDPAGARTVSPS